MITLRVKGLPLTREPHHVDDDGFGVFYLSDKIDWADTCNAARAQVFPGVKMIEYDPVAEAAERRARELLAARKGRR